MALRNPRSHVFVIDRKTFLKRKRHAAEWYGVSDFYECFLSF